LINLVKNKKQEQKNDLFTFFQSFEHFKFKLEFLNASVCHEIFVADKKNDNKVNQNCLKFLEM